MAQTDKQDNFLDIDTGALLENLEGSDSKLGALLSCRRFGMTLQELAEQSLERSGDKYNAIRLALDWLAKPPVAKGIPPLLEKVAARLEGHPGRPPNVYLLTGFGAHILNLLEPNLDIQPPSPRDDWDLAHRFYILKTLERANYAELPAWVEHPLVSDDQNVRADVYMERGELRLTVEIEQKLQRSSLFRAVRKFENWERYIRASRAGSDARAWRMYLVFNVKPRDLPDVLGKWREALTRAGEKLGGLSYEAYYRLACDLFEDWELNLFLDRATLLEPLERRRAPQPVLSVEREGAESDEDPFQGEAGWLPEWMDAKFYAKFKDAMTAVCQAKRGEELSALLNLAENIYKASYSKDSLALQKGVFPRESLWLMRQYLNHPWAKPVKNGLRKVFEKIRKQRGMGMIVFRDTMTRMIWDDVLRHHGLGRGGALRAIFQVPDFQDLQSDYRVDVFVGGKLKDELGETRAKELAEALSWFLSSLHLYTEDLGLGGHAAEKQPDTHRPIYRSKRINWE